MPVSKTDKEFNLEIIEGVCGYCIALNDCRIAGEKPWGGGQVVKRWKINLSTIKRAINREVYATK